MSLESKRQRKKRQRKASRKYFSAWIESKFGYYITGSVKYAASKIKRKFEMKYISILLIILCFGLSTLVYNNVSSYMDAKSQFEKYNPKANTMEKRYQKSEDELSKTTKELNNASSKQSSVLNNADELISELGRYMYTYEDQSSYDNNRESAKKLFKNNKIKESIYSTGYDDNHESIINNLGLTSELDSVQNYNTDKNNNSGDILNIKTIMTYKSLLDETSNDNASHKHTVLYDIKVDAKNNKIIDIKKSKELKSEYEVN